LGCSINEETFFERKNYFYPDLPKGYQISQYDLPFGYNGFLEVELFGDSKRMRINRVHMEEDTGKSTHNNKETLLDFNKSGVALMEIVTEPDFRDVKEVNAFAKRLKLMVRYLDISSADMEKGQMRFELNMSLRPLGMSGLPSYKVEVKNIGSISVLEKTINYEYKRQSDILNGGKMPRQETRGLRDMTGATHEQRVKEGASDYRYFPEPDIPPIILSDSLIEEIKKSLVELPQDKKVKYISIYGMEGNLAETLISTKPRADWFEESIRGIEDKKIILEIAKWIVGDLSSLMKAGKIKFSDLLFKPGDLANLIIMLNQGKISGTMGKQILLEMFKTGKNPESIIIEKNLEIIIDESEVQAFAQKVVKDNPKVVMDLVKNPNAIKYLVGQMMRESKGKVDPHIAEKVLRKTLNLL